MKKHLKKTSFIAGGLLLGCVALPLSASALFNTPSNPGTPPSAPGANPQSIAKAVEKAVGNVIVYPMEQFAQVIKYTFDTRPTQAALQTQSRFPELPASQLATQANADNVNSQLSDLVSKASVNTQALLANAKPEVCQDSAFGKKNCLSPDSASSLLDADQYSTSTQQQAAQQFVKTASGAYIAMPAPDPHWDKSNADVIKYTAFYRTMKAIGSVANHNLSYAYAIRTANGTNPSQMALDKQIMTGDATNPTFWSEINKVPVVGQLVEIADYMPAIAVGIQQEDKYLSMLNNSMSAMLVQQNVLSQTFAGKMLYANAEAASTAPSNNPNNNAPSNTNNPDNSGGASNPNDPTGGDNSNGGGAANSPGSSPGGPSPYSNPPYHKPSKSEAAAYALKHPGKAAAAKNKAHSSSKAQKNAENNM